MPHKKHTQKRGKKKEKREAAAAATQVAIYSG
jgi:hypothetical protein